MIRLTGETKGDTNVSNTIINISIRLTKKKKKKEG